MPRYSTGKRDKNESLICLAITACGGYARKMHESAGFDLLVVFPQTGVHIVEVKNPEYKWKLTSAEQYMMDTVEYHGGAYHVIETAEEIIALAEGD